MVIAKKIIFGKTATSNTWVVENPVDGVLYFPVSGYTKAEVNAMWNAVSLIEIPNKFAQFGLIGAGASCFNPGYYSGNIFDLASYRVFCDASFNPDCIMPHVHGVLGTADDNVNVAYVNNAGDGFFWNAGSNFRFRLDNSQKFNLGYSNRNTFGLSRSAGADTNGYICFLFVTSDNEMGMFRITTVGKNYSYLNWFSAQQRDYILAFLETLEPLPEDEDPYSDLNGEDPIPGDTSVPVPSLPILGATSTGIIGLFAPNEQNMRDLADYMWTDFGGSGSSVEDFLEEIVQALKRLTADPLDYILGLNLIPSRGLSVGSPDTIRFGFLGNTGVSMPRLTSQFFEVDCGTIAFSTLCGDTFLDYAPYSKFSLYLPYVGFVDVDPNDFVGHTMGVIYHGDVVSGAIVAYVTKDGSVMYQYSGNCAVNLPLSSDNWGSTFSAAVGVAASIITPAAIPAAVKEGAAAASESVATKRGIASTVSSVASNPSLLSPSIRHSGTVAGSAGAMGVQIPFVIREAVSFHSTAGFNTINGYPSYYYRKLSQVSGFTTVIGVHIEGSSATAEEIAEIEELLIGGIIL